jgi:hypothetical protein
VTGPRLEGDVLSGGGDWAVERGRRTSELDARYALTLDDGTPVEVHNKGYYVEAEPGSGPRYYLTTPRFQVGRVIDPERAEEGGTPPHAWLEQSVVVGEAFEIDPEHIRIEADLVEHGVTSSISVSS